MEAGLFRVRALRWISLHFTLLPAARRKARSSHQYSLAHGLLELELYGDLF